MADDLLFRPEALKGQMDLVVSGGIQDKAQDQGNDLPGDSGQGRSGYPIFGKPRRPKIIMGSRMIFKIAPVPWMIIE